MIFLPTPDDTDRLGQILAHCLLAERDALIHKGFNIRLEGNLGAGKTSLTRATLRALGVTGRIKSPTFTLLETYPIDSELGLPEADLTITLEPLEAGRSADICATSELGSKVLDALTKAWYLHAEL